MPVSQSICWRFYVLMLITIFGTITSMYYLLVLRDRCRKLWEKSNPSPITNIEAISSSMITNDLTSAISFEKLTQYDLPPSYDKLEHAKRAATDAQAPKQATKEEAAANQTQTIINLPAQIDILNF